jgi:hypothetical protein
MVALDACEAAPTTFVVLTTRNPDIGRRDVYAALRKATLAARRRWPTFEYACFVEFTTGLSVWSGGHRRIHLNLLVKGVPDDDRERLRSVLLKVWGARTNTTQLHVGPIYAAEGLVRYVTNLALHVMKDGQKPPRSYEGHLVRWSLGYFGRGATIMRAEAERAIRVKREAWRQRRDGLPADEAEIVAALEVELAELERWQLVEVRRRPGAAVIEPLGPVERTLSEEAREAIAAARRMRS